MTLRLPLVGMLALLASPLSAADGPLLPVGLARVDVTPKTPIRLSGYANRQTESAGVAQKLFARALAVGGGRDAAVIVTVDVLGVPASMADDVSERLRKKAALPRDRLTVCATHTHSGPTVSQMAPLILGTPLPPEQQAHIDANTRDLADGIERAALDALADRRPARLGSAQGTVGFATNRRVVENGRWVRIGDNPAGPTDPALPVLCASDPAGKVRGLLVNYACHCTTLPSTLNQIHGDWAGIAAEASKRNLGARSLSFPSAAAATRTRPRAARRRTPACTARPLRTRWGSSFPAASRSYAPRQPASWPASRSRSPRCPRRRCGRSGPRARAGRRSSRGSALERLARGEAIPTTVPYVVQGWAFGDDLAMVFLAGEVVVDYSLRLKASWTATACG